MLEGLKKKVNTAKDRRKRLKEAEKKVKEHGRDKEIKAYARKYGIGEEEAEILLAKEKRKETVKSVKKLAKSTRSISDSFDPYKDPLLGGNRAVDDLLGGGGGIDPLGGSNQAVDELLGMSPSKKPRSKKRRKKKDSITIKIER